MYGLEVIAMMPTTPCQLLKWDYNFSSTFSVAYQQGSLWPLEIKIVMAVSMGQISSSYVQMLLDYWHLQSTHAYLLWLNSIVLRISLSGLPVSKKNMLWNKATSALRLWFLGENHPIKNLETEFPAYTWGANIQISFRSWTQPNGTLCSLISRSIQIKAFCFCVLQLFMLPILLLK